jgi:putative hydrolase of the HAD superfamily
MIMLTVKPEFDLQAALSSKTWFGFDLDDTLHEFRYASGQASLSVFEVISAKYGKSVDDLKVRYQEILRESTAHAFTDGRTSSEYRRERFSRLLQAHRIDEFEDIDHLLEIYQSSLRSNLTLKAGALQVLQTLQRLNKKVIVVTEGPADAQDWTIRELGLWPYVDILVTTNEVGRSKVDGLFAAVLEKYSIHPEKIIYFGDNEVRDVHAAQKEGILAFLYDQKQEDQLRFPAALRINSWDKLQNLLLDGKQIRY